jgi:hypothetical protein
MYNSEDEELCDEEKSYHQWVAQNLDFIQNNKQHVSVMKKLYMVGFAAGFVYNQRLSAKEYLEK